MKRMALVLALLTLAIPAPAEAGHCRPVRALGRAVHRVLHPCQKGTTRGARVVHASAYAAPAVRPTSAPTLQYSGPACVGGACVRR